MAHKTRITENAESNSIVPDARWRKAVQEVDNDERFLARIEESRRQPREGKFVRLEDLPD